jgi:hypothetical protein
MKQVDQQLADQAAVEAEMPILAELLVLLIKAMRVVTELAEAEEEAVELELLALAGLLALV